MSNTKEYRDLFITVLASLIAYYFIPEIWFLVFGGSVLVLGLILNFVRKYNHLFWDGITRITQAIFQPILGGIIFILIIIPIGLLSQVFERKKEEKNTTFKDAESKFDLEFFNQQW